MICRCHRNVESIAVDMYCVKGMFELIHRAETLFLTAYSRPRLRDAAHIQANDLDHRGKFENFNNTNFSREELCNIYMMFCGSTRSRPTFE